MCNSHIAPGKLSNGRYIYAGSIPASSTSSVLSGNGQQKNTYRVLSSKTLFLSRNTCVAVYQSISTIDSDILFNCAREERGEYQMRWSTFILKHRNKRSRYRPLDSLPVIICNPHKTTAKLSNDPYILV